MTLKTLADLKKFQGGVFKKLKRCPFCAGPPEVLLASSGFLVRCRYCPCTLFIITKYRRQVVVSWNARREQ